MRPLTLPAVKIHAFIILYRRAHFKPRAYPRINKNGSSQKAGKSRARQRDADSMEAKIALLNAHFSLFVHSLMAKPCQSVEKPQSVRESRSPLGRSIVSVSAHGE